MINVLSLFTDSINEIKVKNMDEANIYKKCGYKNTNDFVKLYSENYKDNVLEIWGKNKGLQKYRNTNPVFDILKVDAYGKCVVIFKDEKGDFISITTVILKEFMLVNFQKQIDIGGESVQMEEETLEAETLEAETDPETKSKAKSKPKPTTLPAQEPNIEKEEEAESDYDSDNSELSYDLYNYSDDEK
jgi:hypothetical protein